MREKVPHCMCITSVLPLDATEMLQKGTDIQGEKQFKLGQTFKLK